MFQLWKLFKLMNRRIQCIVWESHCVRTAISKIIFAIIDEIYIQFKSDCCGRSPILLLNGEWDIFGCFSIFFPSLKMLSNGYLYKTVHMQTTHILFNVGSKRCILHVPSLEKFVHPFKCYQIILLSLTCQMIDCTFVLVNVRVLLLNGQG
jgi:hypothetical protein